MVTETTEQTETMAETDKGDGGEQKRERSDIVFPYSDLGSAIDLARVINERAGIQCQVTQLAAWMNMSATGGTFRSRYSAARIFGLIEAQHGSSARLTNLGQQVLSPQEEARAKATAFLNVPLFRKIYDQQQGFPLPPSAALERMAKDLGVAPKQAERARQTFVKSAQVAQFIDSQTGNFIQPGFPEEDEPGLKNEPPPPDDASKNSDGGSGGGGGGDDNMPPDIDPIIMGTDPPAAKVREAMASKRTKALAGNPGEHISARLHR